MKRTNIIYWVLTGLASALMAFSSISNILQIPAAVDLVVTHLGYPAYFLPLVGWAKLAGAIAIIVPGFPRIKEWAYAGLLYDLLAAMYSGMAVGDAPGVWLPILLPVVLVSSSYIFFHQRKAMMAAA